MILIGYIVVLKQRQQVMLGLQQMWLYPLVVIDW
jgi:hypothetical protein